MFTEARRWKTAEYVGGLKRMMLTIIKKDDDEVQPMAKGKKSCYQHKKMFIKKRFRARRLQILKDPFISDTVSEDDDDDTRTNVSFVTCCVIRGKLFVVCRILFFISTGN